MWAYHKYWVYRRMLHQRYGSKILYHHTNRETSILRNPTNRSRYDNKEPNKERLFASNRRIKIRIGTNIVNPYCWCSTRHALECGSRYLRDTGSNVMWHTALLRKTREADLIITQFNNSSNMFTCEPRAVVYPKIIVCFKIQYHSATYC